MKAVGFTSFYWLRKDLRFELPGNLKTLSFRGVGDDTGFVNEFVIMEGNRPHRLVVETAISLGPDEIDPLSAQRPRLVNLD